MYVHKAYVTSQDRLRQRPAEVYGRRWGSKVQGVVAFVALALIVAAGMINPNVVLAEDLPVIHVSGTISEDETWTDDSLYELDGPVTVPDGVTLTIDPGVIVKYTTGWGLVSLNIGSGGSLNVAGTSGSPVIFTSMKDDTVGGDTNGDGSSSSAAIGDYDKAIVVTHGGTIDISHAQIGYANQAANISCTSSDLVDATIADSILKSQVYSIGCVDGQGSLSLLRNQFDLDSADSHTAIATLDNNPSGIVLGGTDTNTFSGSGVASTVAIDNNYGGRDLDPNSSWTIDGTSGATVQARGINVEGTLNIGPGAIVKSYSSAFNIKSGGTVNVAGTSGDPAIFTSLKDDTVGGDSNGDGSSSVAGVGDYDRAITIPNNTVNATLNVAHAEFTHASQALSITCYDGTSATIVDSTFKSQVYATGCVQGQGAVTLERNSFNLESADSHAAIETLDNNPSGIVLGGTDTNTFSGTGKASTVSVTNNYSGRDLDSASTWVIDGTSGATVEAHNINIEGVLAIGPGAIIKPVTSSGSTFNVKPGGTLNIAGSSSDPVVFTSMKDDTVGGDTNGDGSSSSAAIGDYDKAISVSLGGTATISHMTAQYANQAINVNCNNSGTEFVNASIADSTFKSQVYLAGCIEGQGAVSLLRNHFALDSSDSHYAIETLDNNPSGIVLGGTDTNTFSGSGVATAVQVVNNYSGPDFDAGSTWTISGASGATVHAHNIHVEGTLDLGPGAKLKPSSGTGSLFIVKSGGQVNAIGDSGNPIVVTSMKDDTVGGDTNGNGSSNTPDVGDYDKAFTVEDGGEIVADYLQIKYPNQAIVSAGNLDIRDAIIDHVGNAAYLTDGDVLLEDTSIDHVSSDPALTVIGGAKVIFRGTFDSLAGKAIRACNWDVDEAACAVDVAYVDWGSVNGPFSASGHSGDLICGSVTASPWMYSSTPYVSGAYDSVNCDGNPAAGTSTANASAYSQRIADLQVDCSNGYTDFCTAITNAHACVSAAVTLAENSLPFSPPGSSPTASPITFFGDLLSAAGDYASDNAIDHPIAYGVNIFSEIKEGYSAIKDINTAYNTCFP